MSTGQTLSAVALGLSLGACTPAATSGDAGAGTGTGAGEFVAFASDFDGYRTWAHASVVTDGGSGGAVHTDTVLVESINRGPVARDSDFPQGTILVKEGTTGEPNTRQAFAMVKRGGDYNAGGAAGWEWFELQNTGDGGENTVEILWRGIAPPQGEVYAGKVNGDCNTCHVNAPHDGVYGPLGR